MTQSAPSEQSARSRWTGLLLLIPLGLGILIASLIPRPVVGVIYLNDAIYSYTAQEMIDQIIYARDHAHVKAVVMVLNSPGGTVTDTESVYMELAKLRETKPVITMIEGMAASGAYYLTAGSDYVLAKPSSMVGNVGVIGYAPSTPSVAEDIYSTGPYKLSGSPRDSYMREMEMLKEGFLQAVLLGRGEALKVGPEVILRGQIWPGAEALRMGLVDELGTQSRAFEKAAQMAHIAHARVEDLRSLAGIPTSVPYLFFYETPDGVVTQLPREQGIYMLYIPPAEVLK
jgi:protease-4